MFCRLEPRRLVPTTCCCKEVCATVRRRRMQRLQADCWHCWPDEQPQSWSACRRSCNGSQYFDEPRRCGSGCSARPRLDAGPRCHGFQRWKSALKGAVIAAARQPVTHILDWFHVSIQVRHLEQAFERIRQLEPELKFSCLTSAYFHSWK